MQGRALVGYLGNGALLVPRTMENKFPRQSPQLQAELRGRIVEAERQKNGCARIVTRRLSRTIIKLGLSHAALDAAVLAAYGFNAKKDLLAQLLAPNLDVTARIERGEPLTAPGVPKNYPEPKQLMTQDCSKPD